MTTYSFILFLHVVSAIALFVALALEGGVLLRLRSAENLEQVRLFARIFQRLRTIYIPSFVGILVGGLYLGSKYGGGTYWIPVALGSTLMISLVGGLVTGRRMARLKQAFTDDQTTVSFQSVTAMTKDNALVVSYGLRIGLSLGIVFLMTTKPTLIPSLAAMGASVIVGLTAAAGVLRISNRIGTSCGQWGKTHQQMVAHKA
jgi:hypothetical protein